jgi:hypothetical protein
VLGWAGGIAIVDGMVERRLDDGHSPRGGVEAARACLTEKEVLLVVRGAEHERCRSDAQLG